jgi:hypothetical protein
MNEYKNCCAFISSKSDNPFEFYPDIARKTSKKISKPPPHNLTIFKGKYDFCYRVFSKERKKKLVVFFMQKFTKEDQV